MSDYRGRYSGSKQKKKGHGCLLTALACFAVLGLLAILFFTTPLRNTVYRWFYPQKYAEEVASAGREFGVDEDLIYAVIRTESGFREDVESHAGAVGLMQLTPDTFEWLQEYHLDGEVVFSVERLKDPAVNIRYGTYYLSWLLERYGDVGTACAAYNAGSTNVDSWLADSRYSADGRTLTEIPYSETRKYVERVEDALKQYQELYP